MRGPSTCPERQATSSTEALTSAGERAPGPPPPRLPRQGPPPWRRLPGRQVDRRLRSSRRSPAGPPTDRSPEPRAGSRAGAEGRAHGARTAAPTGTPVPTTPQPDDRQTVSKQATQRVGCGSRRGLPAPVHRACLRTVVACRVRSSAAATKRLPSPGSTPTCLGGREHGRGVPDRPPVRVIGSSARSGIGSTANWRQISHVLEPIAQRISWMTRAGSSTRSAQVADQRRAWVEDHAASEIARSRLRRDLRGLVAARVRPPRELGGRTRRSGRDAEHVRVPACPPRPPPLGVGYLANVVALAGHRNAGIGAQLPRRLPPLRAPAAVCLGGPEPLGTFGALVPSRRLPIRR